MTPSKQRMTEKWQNGMKNNTEKKLYKEWQSKCIGWQIETYITRYNDNTKWMNTNMQGKPKEWYFKIRGWNIRRIEPDSVNYKKCYTRGNQQFYSYQ